MVRIYSFFLLILLSFSQAFAEDTPQSSQPFLLSQALGRLEATEFIELSSVDMLQVNSGFRHCFNSALSTVSVVDVWQPVPSSEPEVQVLKQKVGTLIELIGTCQKETSQAFISRLRSMHELAGDITTLASTIQFEDQAGKQVVVQDAAHVFNLLDLTLRVFQRGHSPFTLKTLEGVETLAELAKDPNLSLALIHQNKVFSPELISHLNVLGGKETFLSRLGLLALFSDFSSDPQNQFTSPQFLMENGRFVISLSYYLTVLGSAHGEEPWDVSARDGSGLAAHLFRVLCEKQFGAKIFTDHDFVNKRLEVKIEIPVSDASEGFSSPSLEGALQRLEQKLWLRPPAPYTESYIFFDTMAQEIVTGLARHQGVMDAVAAKKIVREALRKHLPDGECVVMDSDLLATRLVRLAQRNSTSPWQFKHVKAIAHDLQESVLREARRAAK